MIVDGEAISSFPELFSPDNFKRKEGGERLLEIPTSDRKRALPSLIVVSHHFRLITSSASSFRGLHLRDGYLSELTQPSVEFEKYGEIVHSFRSSLENLVKVSMFPIVHIPHENLQVNSQLRTSCKHHLLPPSIPLIT